MKGEIATGERQVPGKTLLFSDVVFGPLRSRRLGLSLGINLLPADSKLCNFNCVYCECGWSGKRSSSARVFCSREVVAAALKMAAVRLRSEGIVPDTLTFAGNGEPTMHPYFPEIIYDTLRARDEYFPSARVAVLTNASLLNRKKVVDALKSIDLRILKLDAGSEELFQAINQPRSHRTLRWIADHLQYFNGDFIVQSMFLEGEVDGRSVSNTSDDQVEQWLKILQEIKPARVMLYSIDRTTAAPGLRPVGRDRLTEIAQAVNSIGINAVAY